MKRFFLESSGNSRNCGIRAFITARFFLLPVLFLGISVLLYPLDGEEISSPSRNPENSGNALNRLIEISDQLSILNERLQSELQDSRQNSRELQSRLDEAKRELSSLRCELEALRIVSAELLSRAENSRTESTALGEALRKAEASLLNLELSFGTYRQMSEQRIQSLEKENTLWKIGCAAAGILAAGLGAFMIIGR